MNEMTLEQVREQLLGIAALGSDVVKGKEAMRWLDAIDAHITASQPAPSVGVDSLPELPIPRCTYADHSYPAFTPEQMKAYAREALASAPPAGFVVDDIAAEGSPTNRWLFKRMCSAVGIDIGSDTVSEAWLKFAKVLRAAATATKGAEG